MCSVNFADDLSNINVSDLGKVDGMPLQLRVNLNGEDVQNWINIQCTAIRQLLIDSGALLLRGLSIGGSKKLESILISIFGEHLSEYTYRSTPRTKLRGRIYTSSEYHSDETILLHNENAYSNSWPSFIAFCCIRPADEGGSTPIADSRLVYQSIPASIREVFENNSLIYVRNYGEVDLHWTEVFQTKDKNKVISYCNDNNIEISWWSPDRIRTRQIGSSILIHPVSREKIWFNQAHMFHVSSLPESTRADVLSLFKKEDLPRNVYFADGSDIEDEFIESIRSAYKKNEIRFDWEEGDLLLLDNMKFAHGRDPYRGERRVLTGMAKSLSREIEIT